MTVKKIRNIILSMIGILLLLLLILLGIIVYNGVGITIGHCLIADNDSYMLIDENSPIVMSSKHEKMFQNLSTGDKILVVHSGINESYPGGTGAYFCMKLADGDISDISKHVILELTELGWLGQHEETMPYNYEVVNYISDSIKMSLALLENWEYELVEQTEPNGSQGIRFWPKDVTEGKLSLMYYPGAFLKCGTGLESELIVVGNYKAEKGTYDNREHWNHIHFIPFDGRYVVMNEGADSWLMSYEDDLQFILESIRLSDHVTIEKN